MISDKTYTESTVSLQELFPSYAKQFLEPFENIVEPVFHKDMHLPFKIADRKHSHKVSPTLRLARPEDAHEIVEIYKELYKKTYPYKEMEDEQEVRRMIEDPSIQWIIYQDPSFKIAGCITFVLDFNNSRGYIRGFMLRERYQGYIDITKAMIGSMLGMLHKYKDIILMWYVENRTFHSKSQYSMWVCGIAPVGFYPNKDVFLGEVESDLMQVLYDEKVLREYRSHDIPRVISVVEPCYQYSEERYNLGTYMII
ncbi:MAG: GNAT family N-acetyltransferase, partial [Promethearchaeota archaeon]